MSITLHWSAGYGGKIKGEVLSPVQPTAAPVPTYTKGIPPAELGPTQGALAPPEPTKGLVPVVPQVPQSKGPKPGPATAAPVVTAGRKGPKPASSGPVVPVVPQGKAPKPVPQGLVPVVPQGKGPKPVVPAPGPVIPQGKPPKPAVPEQVPVVPQGKPPKPIVPLVPQGKGPKPVVPVAPAVTPQGKPPKAAIDGVPAVPQGKAPKPASPVLAAVTQGKPPKPSTPDAVPVVTQGKPPKPALPGPVPVIPQGKAPKPAAPGGVPVVPQDKGPKPVVPQSGGPEGKRQKLVGEIPPITGVPQGPVLGPLAAESAALAPQEDLQLPQLQNQKGIVPQSGVPQDYNAMPAMPQLFSGLSQKKGAKIRVISKRMQYRVCP